VEFYGNAITTSYPKYIDTLQGQLVALEGEYTGLMYAYDGVLLFDSYKYSDYWFYLYDLEQGKLINKICKMGNGPNEYFAEPSIGDFVKDSGKICLWINNGAKNRIELISMHGEVVKTINTSKFKSTNWYGLGSFSVLNDSLLLAYVSSSEVFENKFSAPSNQIFNYRQGKAVKEYTFYSDFVVEDVPGLTSKNSYLSAIGGRNIKPDRSKLVYVMPFLKRVDILDFKSGKMKSVQLKDSPDLNLISSGEPIKMHYRAVDCDERYIYVMEGDLERIFGTINVFDWDGNFVRVLRINESGDVVFTVDPIRKILYTKNDAEKVTAYDVNYLYE
jgi:hypothetical protein